MLITAYIPCFNNAATLAGALRSIGQQSAPIAEILVVDDGSSDNSCRIAQDFGARIVCHETNLGRGAARARALREAAHDLVLSCDATNAIQPDFVERALPMLEAPNVAAVFGRMWQNDGSTVAQRWRGRHLFKIDAPQTLNRHALLATWGVIMRKSHVLSAGNFDSNLRHTEDADLGQRLLAKGYEVIFDPTIHVLSLSDNTLPEVLERYWRWYAGKNEAISWKAYVRQVVYSTKVMACRDFQAGDMLSIPISLFSPHYQFWRSWMRRVRKSSQFQ